LRRSVPGGACYGLEIDPLYVDNRCAPLAGIHTRDEARHVPSGRLFREMEAEVEGKKCGKRRTAITK